MEVKMLEIRDYGTFIPVMCIEMVSEKLSERYLLGRLGFSYESPLIQLVWISSSRTEYSPFEWNDRTLFTAHTYITENWRELISGDVVDVEYLLGDTGAPKASERFRSTEVESEE